MVRTLESWTVDHGQYKGTSSGTTVGRHSQIWEAPRPNKAFERYYRLFVLRYLPPVQHHPHRVNSIIVLHQLGSASY
jgi:hypothetical protein